MSVDHGSERGESDEKKEKLLSVKEEVNELQQQQFSLVEEQLKILGIGLTKEIAIRQGTQLCDSVKSVELKESGLTEILCGRKMYTNIRTIYVKYTMGKILAELAETNYPIDRYIEMLQEYLNDLRDKKNALQVPRVLPPKTMELYMIKAEREYDTLIKAQQAQQEAKKTKKAKKAVVAEAGAGDDGDSEPEGQVNFETIQKKYRYEYADANDKYDEYLVKCDKVKIAEQELAELETRTVVVSLLVDSLRTASNTLVQKIQAAVMSYDKVKQKLSGVVTLTRTGETIINPFGSNNLAGMCQILKMEYYTPTLIQFNNDFSDTLRCSIPAADVLSNPMKAVQLTDKRIAEWITMDYWKYMTMDIFFVNILLGYVPASPLKDKCVIAVEEFIMKREDAGDWVETYSQVSLGSSVRTMPIYKFLSEYIHRVENSSKHRSVFSTNGVNAGNTPTGAPNKAGTAKDNNFGGGKRYGGNVEAAAAAETRYTTYVTRDQNVVIKDVETGREFPYTATREECSICYGKSDPGTHFQKLPGKCYRGCCRVCYLCGHKAGNCMQHSSTYGPKPPAEKK